MNKQLKAFILSPEIEGNVQKELQEKVSIANIEVEWTEYVSADEFDKGKILTQYDFGVVRGSFCLELAKIVKRRSVGSHFLNYIDFIKVDQKKELWGQCLFKAVLEKVFRNHIKSQDYKGAVIFLGESPLIYPSLGVLSGFGFNDFVFLQSGESGGSLRDYKSALSGLFDVKTNSVNSEAFIQSQKEYSLCFVLENNYTEQTLEDMSYFHFLSSRSMVFNLAGQSNFLFDEVKALGVNVVEYDELSKVYFQMLEAEIKKGF